jgi:RNA polymerase sigma-70 factor, ECF subfamily
MSVSPSTGISRKTADDLDEQIANDIVAAGIGDRGAFQRLYRATAPRLLSICLNVTRDRLSAEDVLQSAFVKIWQSATRFDPARARPMAWLGSITRNCAIDWYRAQRPRDQSSDQAIDTIPSASEAVDARIIREEDEERVMSLVHGLEEDLETQVRRIYLEGMTYVEAAESEGVPLGTLKSRVRRALMTIRMKMIDD